MNSIMLEKQIKDYAILAETFTLTAFFWYLNWCYFSENIVSYLMKTSNLSIDDLQKRWDWFDSVFWKEKWTLISALSFSTIIEARWELLNKTIKNISDENTIIIELASGFNPRWLYFVNKLWCNEKYFIETDLSKTIHLKSKFYDYLKTTWMKTPSLEKQNVENKNDWYNIYNKIKLLKWENQQIKKVIIVCEGLLIYLDKKHQKVFFEELNIIQELLKNEDIQTSFLTIDMPTHENFTNWLVLEWFDFTSHINVMKNVDPIILESLHNTQRDFLWENWLKTIQKYYYDDDIINNLHTPSLDKYKDLEWLKYKIQNFLKQNILYAWLID